MKKTFLILFAVVSCARADPFRNLGFEEADVSNVQVGGGASASQLIPGWHLFSEDYGEVTALTYDHKLTEPGDFTLFDSPPQGGAPVEGRFYLAWVDLLKFDFPFGTEKTSLVQRGMFHQMLRRFISIAFAAYLTFRLTARVFLRSIILRPKSERMCPLMLAKMLNEHQFCSI